MKKALNSLENKGLKGKVRSVECDTYFASEENGEILCASRIDTDGLSYFDVYDLNGRVVEHSVKDDKGRVYEKNVYLYDEHDNRIKDVVFDGNITLYSIEYVYDESSNLLQKVESDCDGEVIRKTVYCYDESGNMDSVSIYDEEGEMFGEQRFQYDANGNILKSDSSDGGENGVSTFVYDENGRMVEAQMFNGDENVCDVRQVFEYTDNGYISKKTLFKGYDLPETSSSYEYDSEGKVIRCIETDCEVNESVVLEYIYQKDGHGNVIQKITYVNSAPSVIEKMVIEYFD